MRVELNSVNRWGHIAHIVSDGSRIVVFGGYGSHFSDSDGLLASKSCHSRGNSLMVCDREYDAELNNEIATFGPWRMIDPSGVIPSPREHLASCELPECFGGKDRVFLHGGMKNPHFAHDDGFILDCRSLEFKRCKFVGDTLPGLFRHVVIPADHALIIHGGRLSDDLVENGLYILNFVEENFESVVISVRRLEVDGLDPRHSHSATWFDNSVFLYGGFISGGVGKNPSDPHVYTIQVSSETESRVQAKCIGFSSTRSSPLPRYSHDGFTIDNNWIVLGGVNPSGSTIEVAIFDLVSHTWSYPVIDWSQSTQQPRNAMFAKHKVVGMRFPGEKDRFSILVIGGGALCFSFGSSFNPGMTFSVENWKRPEESWVPYFHGKEFTGCNVLTDCGFQDAIDKVMKSNRYHLSGSKELNLESFENLEKQDRDKTCQVCFRLFGSRNKLFKHIELTDHRMNR